jgi:hypothetical protein
MVSDIYNVAAFIGCNSKNMLTMLKIKAGMLEKDNKQVK